MSTLQFYLKDEAGNHQYVIDPVESFTETDEHWIIDNGWNVYEVEKSEYEECTAYIRLTPADDNPLWRMSHRLEAIKSTVQIDWS